jgi:hypothetical protein
LEIDLTLLRAVHMMTDMDRQRGVQDAHRGYEVDTPEPETIEPESDTPDEEAA